MVNSRGGVSGGLTIADALREFESRGYIGQFGVREGGLVECNACGVQHRPAALSLDAVRRIEGVSDPADMVFVGALQCPNCGRQGTAVIPYGPNVGPSTAAVLRGLDHQHRTSMGSSKGDESLVSDSGWLRGPDG